MMKVQLKTRLFNKVSIGTLVTCMMVFGLGMTVQAKTIELSLSHHLPPIAPAAKALEQWAKRIEADANGQIKITIFPSGSLVKGREAFSGTVSGMCDIAFVNNVYERNKWALNNIVNLEALPMPTDERGVQIWDKLWEKFPVMLKEYEGTKVLSHSVDMYSSIHTTKKQVRVPADTKGMKIAAMGGKVKILENAGAAPVGIPANDWYLSLEKGVIEGNFCPVGLLTDRGIEVLLPYHLDLPMGQGGNCLIMNANKFNSLPADVKTNIVQLYSWTNELISQANSRLVEDAWAKCRDEGHTIVKPTAEELNLWLEAARPVANYWIKSNAKKGPTQEMFDYAKQLIAEMK